MKKQDVTILAIEPIDLTCLSPGGIDTAINDFLTYGEFDLRIAGITNDSSKLGKWQHMVLNNKKIRFIPILLMDKNASRRIPHSILMMFAIIRYRKLISEFKLIQTHRVELGILINYIFRKSVNIQFIHNDGSNFQKHLSESYWRLFPKIYLFLEKLTTKKSLIVFAFSKSTTDRLCNFSRKVFYSSTWYDQRVFFLERDLDMCNSVKMLFVGRFEQQKDPLLWAEVANVLKLRTSIEFEFLMVGSGSLKYEIMNKVNTLKLQNSTKFLGKLNRSEVASQMNSADVLLMTSHYEGSPRIIYEASACGLPVVGTRESDPDGWLDGYNGISVNSRDASELAVAVLDALKLDRTYCQEKAKQNTAVKKIREIESGLLSVLTSGDT